MINFTVGPVQSNLEVRKIGAEQVPYFRTEEFSNIMKENERLVKEFAKADENSRVVFITGSGTASMEASIINTLTEEDRVIVVNGGSFGGRFVSLLELHNIKYDAINLEFGKTLKKVLFEKGNSTFMGTPMDETSVLSQSIIFEFAFNQKECTSVEQLKKIKEVSKECFKMIGTCINEKFDISVSYLIYNAIPDIFYSSNNDNVKHISTKKTK